VKLTYGTLPSSLTFTGFDARFDNASSTTAFAVATVADGTAIVAPPPATVAEPAALGVLTVGLIGLAIAKRRRGDGNAMSAAFA